MSNLEPCDSHGGDIASFATRIINLLNSSKINSSTDALDWIDQLLGAVYSLHFAKPEFKERPQPTNESEQQEMLREMKRTITNRAEELAKGKPRDIGVWMAGVHFNSALYRISACHDRGLKITSGQDLKNPIKTKERGIDRIGPNARAIREQVNLMKHREGILEGRKAGLTEATAAVGELLSFMESWAK